MKYAVISDSPSIRSINCSFLQMMAAAGAFIKKENVDPDLVPALAPALAPDLVPMVIINNVNIKQEVNVENSELQERMDHGVDVGYRSEMVNLNRNAYVN